MHIASPKILLDYHKNYHSHNAKKTAYSKIHTYANEFRKGKSFFSRHITCRLISLSYLPIITITSLASGVIGVVIAFFSLLFFSFDHYFLVINNYAFSNIGSFSEIAKDLFECVFRFLNPDLPLREECIYIPPHKTYVTMDDGSKSIESATEISDPYEDDFNPHSDNELSDECDGSRVGPDWGLSPISRFN